MKNSTVVACDNGWNAAFVTSFSLFDVAHAASNPIPSGWLSSLRLTKNRERIYLHRFPPIFPRPATALPARLFPSSPSINPDCPFVPLPTLAYSLQCLPPSQKKAHSHNSVGICPDYQGNLHLAYECKMCPDCENSNKKLIIRNLYKIQPNSNFADGNRLGFLFLKK